ncbi:DUF1638 domain-containing protein [Prosthecomicrobium sp. N25]|uniref:DUF1638 domain-containing protein n=1 Tax=Prosthecomicrobium sp. N25 TaxID=3129254 RepID=UPI003078230F
MTDGGRSGGGRRGGRAARLARLAPDRHAPARPAEACADAGSTEPFGPNAERTLVIACGALAQELLAVIRLNGLDRIAVACLPAKLHNRPEKIPNAVRCRIRAARRREGYGRVLVLYGDCGTGGALDRVLAEEGVERIAGDHCYAFYAGPDAFEALQAEEVGTFYLTDYLARQFETLVVRGLGLDRHPELLPAYFGHYRRLVHLQQVPDPETEAKARAAAERLGLAFERRETGFGLITPFLRGGGAAPSPDAGGALPPAGPAC